MNFHEKSTLVNNCPISYIDEGPDQANVILFIHGFPFNKFMWNRQVTALKANSRVIAYDVRGHGHSGSNSEDFTIDLFVRDMIGLMDALQIDKACLCGLSMGGYISLNAVINYPDRFESLILCDTTCVADSEEGKEKRLNTIEDIKSNGVEKYADESIKKLFAPESLINRKGDVATVREMIMNTPSDTLIRTLLAMAGRNETCSRLPEIDIPVLLMVGEEDTITPPSAARQMHEKIQGSLLNVIEHAGHLSNMENSPDFNHHLVQFVK